MTMLRVLVDAPRWLFLAVLMFAPWAYGGTRAWTITAINALLGAVLVLWGVELLVRRRRPAVHPVLGACAGALLLLGWWMTLNAHSVFDSGNFLFVQRDALAPGAPGSVARDVSLAMMLRVTVMVGALLLVSDLWPRPVWRQRIWTTACLTGLSIVVFGFVQKLAGEPFVTWQNRETARTYFALYRYHANAGAFINLAWPLIVGKAALAFARSNSGPTKGFWLGAALVCLAAAFVNASKAAMTVSLILAAVLACWIGIRFRRQLFRRGALSIKTAIATAVAVLALLAVTAVLVPWQRWDELFERSWHDRNERLLVAGVSWRMMPDAGAFGFGPGTWATKFPFYTHHLGDEVKGVWRFAHQDYLQALVEWGYVGAALWAVLFGGGLLLCFRNARTQPSGDGGRTLLFLAGVATGGIALHAMVDFPLQIASLQLYTVVCLGFGWGAAAAKRRSATALDAEAEPPFKTGSSSFTTPRPDPSERGSIRGG